LKIFVKLVDVRSVSTLSMFEERPSRKVLDLARGDPTGTRALTVPLCTARGREHSLCSSMANTEKDVSKGPTL